MDFDTFVGHLDRPRKSGPDSIRARCPACGDKNQTKLSVKETGDGRILLHCFAGCSPDDVVGELGLKLEDLMPPKTDHAKPIRGAFRRDAVQQLKGDLNVVWIFLNDIARGNPLTDADRKRAGEYGRRVANFISEVS